MTDLDWNLIRSFVAVAETGSLSAAARKLAASQPTLGRHVAELEQALGVVLFRRGRTGYELTEQGAALFERAQTVGEAANAFARLATGATEQIAGTVRIAASEVVSAYVLPPMLARLRQAGAGNRGRDRRLEPGREPAATRCRYRRAHGRAGPAGPDRPQDRRPAADRMCGEDPISIGAAGPRGPRICSPTT